jgi:hypothetical protein
LLKQKDIGGSLKFVITELKCKLLIWETAKGVIERKVNFPFFKNSDLHFQLCGGIAPYKLVPNIPHLQTFKYGMEVTHIKTKEEKGKTKVSSILFRVYKPSIVN